MISKLFVTYNWRRIGKKNTETSQGVRNDNVGRRGFAVIDRSFGFLHEYTKSLRSKRVNCINQGTELHTYKKKERKTLDMYTMKRALI